MGEDISSRKVYAVNGLNLVELGKTVETTLEAVDKALDLVTEGELELAVDIGHISRKRFKKLAMSRGVSRNEANILANRIWLHSGCFSYLDILFLDGIYEFYLHRRIK